MTSQNSYESFDYDDHSASDIEEVKRLAFEEQQRQISDTDGELIRKNNAYFVSAMVEASVRPTWFKQGSTYVLDVLELARNTTNGIALTASQARARVLALGQQGIETVNDFKHRVEVAGTKTIETAQDVKAKSIDAAQNAKLRIEHTAEDLTNAVHGAQAMVQQKIDAAYETKDNITSSARQGAKKVQGLVRSLSQNLIEKANNVWTQMTANSLTAYVVLEEERERIYRIANDVEDGYAIVNAYTTASLIKQLAPEFYRPTSEPSSLYYTRLLEDGERARRVKQDLLDGFAQSNAAAVSKIVPRHTVSRPLPMAKQEVVEQITVSRPLLASM